MGIQIICLLVAVCWALAPHWMKLRKRVAVVDPVLYLSTESMIQVTPQLLQIRRWWILHLEPLLQIQRNTHTHTSESAVKKAGAAQYEGDRCLLSVPPPDTGRQNLPVVSTEMCIIDEPPRGTPSTEQTHLVTDQFPLLLVVILTEELHLVGREIHHVLRTQRQNKDGGFKKGVVRS